jgi:hypothetical protein
MAKYEHVKIEGIAFKPGEPWFLIRAQDRFAPAAVEAYANLVGGSVTPEMAAGVRAIADSMRKWQAEHTEAVKTPD